MTELNQVYKCNVCGIISEVLHEGGGELSCCGQAMQLMAENTVDAAKEKHVPVVELVDGKLKVRVGSVPHPMDEDHYIEWIEVLVGGVVRGRKMLKPGDQPEADFCLCTTEGVTARAYCNLHGLWKSN